MTQHPLGQDIASRSKTTRQFLGRLWRLTKPYFQSGERRRAWTMLGVIIAFTIAGVIISAVLTYWYQGFYNSMQKYDTDAIWRDIGIFTIIATASVAMNVLQQYMASVFQNRWRRWMTTAFLHRWMRRHVYYRMQIDGSNVDNPDQRIAQDLEYFTAQTLSLPLGMLSAIVTIVIFSFVLWNLGQPITVFGTHIPGYLLWVNIIYAAVGTWILVKIGKPLFWLSNTYQQAQGDFRYGLARVRENSESIATSRGHVATTRHLLSKYKPVFTLFHLQIRRNIGVNSFSGAFNQAAVLIPLLAVLPAYLSHQVGLGGVMAVLSAFGNIQQAFAYIINNFSGQGSGYMALTDWLAVTDRLDQLKRASQQHLPNETSITRERASDGHLHLSDLSLYRPSGTPLVAGLDLELVPGDRLLLTGRTGVGKSTLLRVLAGIWPYAQGRIEAPDAETCFVPQRIYLPESPLIEAIVHPRTRPADPDEVCHWLDRCELGYLKDELSTTARWDRQLSLGELQRLAFVRLLLVRARWNLLDEITSALDESLEQSLYQMLIDTLPEDAVIVSVAHRSTLRPFHTRELRLMPDQPPEHHALS